MESSRNIKYTLRRYPLPLLMSVIGLIIAVSAYMVISVQLDFERGFDRFHPHADNIFRVDMTDNNTIFRSVLPPGFADEVINSSSHIEAGTVVCPFLGEIYINAAKDGVSDGFIENANVVSEDFFNVFEIKIVEGDPYMLKYSDKMAIPLSLAKKIFGNTSAVGKHIEIKSGTGFLRQENWQVGAVYEDLPENSQIRNDIYMRIPDFFLQNFGSSNFVCYLRLDDKSSSKLVESEFNGKFDFSRYNHLTPIHLTPLPDVYFHEEKSDGRVFRSGSRTQAEVLGIIALLTIVIGFLNFTNFYTSLIPSRLKSVNTRIILGEKVANIRVEVVLETLTLAVFAFIVSVIVVEIISPWFRVIGIVNTGFDFRNNFSVLIKEFILVVAGGILSGIYPAYFATSHTNELVVKGNFSLSTSGIRIKKSLLCLQYIISCSLMVFIVFVYLQNRMMLQVDPKFDKSRIAMVELTSDIAMGKGEWIKEELCCNSSIEDVAFASEKIGAQDVYCTENIEMNDVSISTFLIYVTNNFLDVMGIDITEGEGFPRIGGGSVIMNEYAREHYDLELGRSVFTDDKITGFCENVTLTSMRKEQSPVCFVSLPLEKGYMNVMYLRLYDGYDKSSVISHIKNVVSRIDPEYPVEVMFYDRIDSIQYIRESTFENAITCLSAIAIFLSLIGAFSMVIFDIQNKKKEIAVRKVFGAGYTDVLWLGNKPYSVVVLIGFILSVPISLIAIDEYMMGFTRRIDLSVWVYLLVLLVVQVLTALLVVSRYNSIAKESPNVSLDSE